VPFLEIISILQLAILFTRAKAPRHLQLYINDCEYEKPDICDVMTCMVIVPSLPRASFQRPSQCRHVPLSDHNFGLVHGDNAWIRNSLPRYGFDITLTPSHRKTLEGSWISAEGSRRTGTYAYVPIVRFMSKARLFFDWDRLFSMSN
jgi:hypothetical protein